LGGAATVSFSLRRAWFGMLKRWRTFAMHQFF